MIIETKTQQKKTADKFFSQSRSQKTTKKIENNLIKKNH
jgi:hypothetical protein